MFGNPLFLWLVAGVGFYIADMFVTRYNLKFAAYAAFTIAVFLMIGIMRLPDPAQPEQMEYYNYFIISEVICFIIAIFAWKFVFRDVEGKSNLSTEEKEFYGSLKDKTVEAGKNGINSVSGGEVVFAGKTLKARLANTDSETVEAGTKMLVKEVEGDTLVVTIK